MEQNNAAGNSIGKLRADRSGRSAQSWLRGKAPVRMQPLAIVEPKLVFFRRCCAPSTMVTE
jgi:hypothetical protein